MTKASEPRHLSAVAALSESPLLVISVTGLFNLNRVNNRVNVSACRPAGAQTW